MTKKVSSGVMYILIGILVVLLFMATMSSLTVYAEKESDSVLPPSNPLRHDLVVRVNLIVDLTDALDVRLYENNDSLNKLLTLVNDCKRHINKINEWSDSLILDRANKLEQYYSGIVLREDKKKLLDLLNYSEENQEDILYEPLFDEEEKAEYNELIQGANKVLNTRDANETDTMYYTDELTKFLNKYAVDPLAMRIVYAVLLILTVIVSGGIIYSDDDSFAGFVVLLILGVLLFAAYMALDFLTFLPWWANLLIILPMWIVVDGLGVTITMAVLD